MSPTVCHNSEVAENLEKLAKLYIERCGYSVLANSYARNILSGTWLWRNKRSPSISICVKQLGGETINVDDAQKLKWDGNWNNHQNSLCKLEKIIECGLTSEDDNCYLEIIATIKNRFMQPIYPSQLVSDQDQTKKKEEKVKQKEDKQYKELASALIVGGTSSACFTQQKVGAAIQLIDEWYGGDKPIRVNHYGAVVDRGIAFRTPEKENDAYTLLTKVESYIQFLEINELGKCKTSDEIHFVMAMLVRGGVHNGFGKKNKSN